jgi:hypothetical protein
MNMIVRLYAALTAVSLWVEDLRVKLLFRAYGITHDEKPPVPWREREGLPSRDQWPKIKMTGGLQIERPIWVRGKVKVGPVHPIPAKIDGETKNAG